jgi:hypothetical protein
MQNTIRKDIRKDDGSFALKPVETIRQQCTDYKDLS